MANKFCHFVENVNDITWIQFWVKVNSTNSTYDLHHAHSTTNKRVTRRVLIVKQEILTLPKHMSSPRFLVWFVFCLKVLCRSFFVHSVVFPSLINGFWLPLLNLKTCLVIYQMIWKFQDTCDTTTVPPETETNQNSMYTYIFSVSMECVKT